MLRCNSVVRAGASARATITVSATFVRMYARNWVALSNRFSIFRS